MRTRVMAHNYARNELLVCHRGEGVVTFRIYGDVVIKNEPLPGRTLLRGTSHVS